MSIPKKENQKKKKVLTILKIDRASLWESTLKELAHVSLTATLLTTPSESLRLRSCRLVIEASVGYSQRSGS